MKQSSNGVSPRLGDSVQAACDYSPSARLAAAGGDRAWGWASRTAGGSEAGQTQPRLWEAGVWRGGSDWTPVRSSSWGPRQRPATLVSLATRTAVRHLPGSQASPALCPPHPHPQVSVGTGNRSSDVPALSCRQALHLRPLLGARRPRICTPGAGQPGLCGVGDRLPTRRGAGT